MCLNLTIVATAQQVPPLSTGASSSTPANGAGSAGELLPDPEDAEVEAMLSAGPNNASVGGPHVLQSSSKSGFDTTVEGCCAMLCFFRLGRRQQFCSEPIDGPPGGGLLLLQSSFELLLFNIVSTTVICSLCTNPSGWGVIIKDDELRTLYCVRGTMTTR